MEPKSGRPHFVRSTTREKNIFIQNKQKIMILALRKIFMKQIKRYFNKIKQSHTGTQHFLQTAQKIVHNITIHNKQIAWKKLKVQANIREKQITSAKQIFNLSRALRKRIIIQSWLRLTQYGYNKQIKSQQKILVSRNRIAYRIFRNFYLKRLNLGFHKIILYQKNKQNTLIALKGLNFMIKQRYEKDKLRAWSKLCRFSSAEQKDLQYQLGQVMKEVDMLKKQLYEKNQENQELYLKLQTREENLRFKTISDIETNGKGSARSVDVKRSVSLEKKRSHSNQKDEKKSDTGSQYSVLSWINNSFLSFKSGKSSRAISGVQCFCVYREKYNQYKYQSASLKNQLQIIKNQLEVTKDVNEHLQQEISNFYGVQDNSYELQRLRKQCKELRKQRDTLKQKMMKYQKYVANLKIEFKNKIESLYRNIKKNQ